MAVLVNSRLQAVAGVVPPEQGEALIRANFPSVEVQGPIARLGRMLMLTIIGAPIAWMMLSPFYFKKIMPFMMTRYILTNRRIMIQKGWKGKVSEEVPLAEIDEVRLAEKNDTSDFFRAATLEIISGGKVKLTLQGVPEADSFRHAILNACMAWVPGKAKAWNNFIPAKAE